MTPETAGVPRAGAEPVGECGLLARVRPEDFRVEEVEGVSASGSGEHVLMRVEKRGIDTLEAIRRLARALGVRPAEFGRAGLKDARAETVQLLSVRGVEAHAARDLELPDLRVTQFVHDTNRRWPQCGRSQQCHVDHCHVVDDDCHVGL